MQTHPKPAFDLHPAAIVTGSGATEGRPVERMMAAQVAAGRLVDFLCGLPAHLTFTQRARPIGRAQTGDAR